MSSGHGIKARAARTVTLPREYASTRVACVRARVYYVAKGHEGWLRGSRMPLSRESLGVALRRGKRRGEASGEDRAKGTQKRKEGPARTATAKSGCFRCDRCGAPPSRARYPLKLSFFRSGRPLVTLSRPRGRRKALCSTLFCVSRPASRRVRIPRRRKPQCHGFRNFLSSEHRRTCRRGDASTARFN